MKAWVQQGLALLAGIVLVGGVLSAPAYAATPPAGRGSYVVGVLGDSPTKGRSWVRLAMYSLRADGSARMDYWAWNQDKTLLRTPTGFRTSGCQYDCPVWTSEGFEPGAGPSQTFGTWSVQGDKVEIKWSDTVTEVWRYVNHDNITKLDLNSATNRPTVGWGWGSTKGFSTYATMSQIKSKNVALAGLYRQNNYGESSGTQKTGLDLSLFGQCNANCLRLHTTDDKYYLAGGSAQTGQLDGRKLYYNLQKFKVDSSKCIGEQSEIGAGHLRPSLQIIDDTGAFRGMISVEATVYKPVPGGAIIGLFDLNDVPAA